MTTLESQKVKEQLILLKQFGLTYQRISQLSGINASSIRNLVCGCRENLSDTNYRKLQKFLKEYEPLLKGIKEVTK